MKFTEWKIRLGRELIKIQHSTNDNMVKLTVIEILESLKYARKRDLYNIIMKLNVLITNYGYKDLIKFIEQLDDIMEGDGNE